MLVDSKLFAFVASVSEDNFGVVGFCSCSVMEAGEADNDSRLEEGLVSVC